MTNLADNLNMTGHVVIESVDSLGNRTVILDDKNLIVSAGRMALADVLAGKRSASAINDIAFGDGGVLPNNSAVALSINPEETSVKHRITAIQPRIDYTFNIDAMKANTPKVVASITIPKVPVGFSSATPGASSNAGLNGKSISELALMMQDGVAFSIKRFPAIPKSDAISLIITWTIYL